VEEPGLKGEAELAASGLDILSIHEKQASIQAGCPVWKRRQSIRLGGKEHEKKREKKLVRT